MLAGHVHGGVELRRQRQEALVVVQHVVVEAEAGPDGGLAAGARRLRDADARHPGFFCAVGAWKLIRPGTFEIAFRVWSVSLYGTVWYS